MYNMMKFHDTVMLEMQKYVPFLGYLCSGIIICEFRFKKHPAIISILFFY